MKTASLIKIAAPLLFLWLAPGSLAQGTAFTYQGRLSEDGQPANGNYDLAFQLFDAPVNGNAGSDRFEFSSQAVNDGLFTVELDFGPFIFTGQDLWLQLEARAVGEPAWDLLSPRQALTPTPYAIHAATAGSAPIPDGSITASKLGEGAVSAAALQSGSVGAPALANDAVDSLRILDGSVHRDDIDFASFEQTVWLLGGNAGTTPGIHFLGTSDNQPLEFHVNGLRALRIEYAVDHNSAFAPNLIAGSTLNNVYSGVIGATIAGGTLNRVTGLYDVVSGGASNLAAGHAFATVGGGWANTASGGSSAIAGGDENTASGNHATVSGGWGSRATGDSSSIGGGQHNWGSGYGTTIGGGLNNRASDDQTTIGGGYSNTASGDYSTIGGGLYNTVTASYATISGGGPSNRESPEASQDSINRTSDDYGVIGGGGGNRAGNGNEDPTDATFATVAGGKNNRATGIHSSIPGGFENEAQGAYSFAAGCRAQALHSGSFVWADVAGLVAPIRFPSIRNNEFAIRAAGGVRLDTSTSMFFGSATRQMLNLWGTTYGIGVQSSTLYQRSDGGFSWFKGGEHSNSANDPGEGGTRMMELTSAGLKVNGTMVLTSDRNAKENFSHVDPQEVLDRVLDLPIERWNYREDENQIPHLGPMAQDFSSAFGVGADDKHIATVDADGVALAAIQGLNRKLEAENEQLRKRLDALESVVTKLVEKGEQP